MPELTAEKLKSEVKTYRNRRSGDTWLTHVPNFFRECFEQLEELRYADHPLCTQ
jgi:hypothetical protein